MVSYHTSGRLGNALFMAANCISYALKHGLEFSIPRTSTDPFWNPTAVTHLYNPNWNPQLEKIIVNEPHFHYAPIPFEESWRDKNIILNGYYQSPLYLEGYRDKILELFAYPWHLEPEICAVQARFGDYLTIEGKHILISEPYLRAAIDMVKKGKGIHRFKVFSDDLRYFKQNFGHIYDFEYSTNKTIEEDLIEGSWCHSNINSSSTFSWWMAYLGRNEDKMVITPEKWFGEGWRDEYNREVITNTIVPDNWIKIAS
jgi:hypothetical protein